MKINAVGPPEALLGIGVLGDQTPVDEPVNMGALSAPETVAVDRLTHETARRIIDTASLDATDATTASMEQGELRPALDLSSNIIHAALLTERAWPDALTLQKIDQAVAEQARLVRLAEQAQTVDHDAHATKVRAELADPDSTATQKLASTTANPKPPRRFNPYLETNGIDPAAVVLSQFMQESHSVGGHDGVNVPPTTEVARLTTDCKRGGSFIYVPPEVVKKKAKKALSHHDFLLVAQRRKQQSAPLSKVIAAARRRRGRIKLPKSQPCLSDPGHIGGVECAVFWVFSDTAKACGRSGRVAFDTYPGSP